MKGAYKKRDRRYDAQTGKSYVVRRRDLRRNRRIAVLVLVVCAVLAVLFVDYLLGEGEDLQGDLLDGADQEQPAVLQEEAEEGKAAGNQAIEDPTTSMVLLGEFFTDYAWDPDPSRQANLKAASSRISGTTLAPGETFSAIEVLGSPEDYETAKVFANGGADKAEGGGLCQVSSTLYMAANYAGLEIVEREPHYAELPYIQPGLDATVWFGENGWGALDMRFKNNTDGDIVLRQYVNDDGFMIAQVYGEKPTGKQVSMDSEKVEENPNKGIKWATYKTVKDSNGNVLEDGLMYETLYSYNPPTPPEMKHETHEPRGSGWLDPSNTTNWGNR
ncbi:MAG: VanW family protein [Actinomycetota bacterium]|nr:VanW family protein [Actinomycetota bacterium]